MPVTRVSGWKRLLYVLERTSSMTFGSRSMYSERGTCFPEEVSEKNVLKPVSCLEGEPSTMRPSGYGCMSVRKSG